MRTITVAFWNPETTLFSPNIDKKSYLNSFRLSQIKKRVPRYSWHSRCHYHTKYRFQFTLYLHTPFLDSSTMLECSLLFARSWVQIIAARSDQIFENWYSFISSLAPGIKDLGREQAVKTGDRSRTHVTPSTNLLNYHPLNWGVTAGSPWAQQL